jgi:uncharacterized protein YdeI (YjbR/CyaY-like superfamily)
MNGFNPKVDAFLDGARKWRAELEKLRAILLDCQLVEDFKWGKPCYTFEGGNVIALAELKDCCWLMFFKGVLLPDAEGILAKAGENSQSMRVIRFSNVQEIAAIEPILKAYIHAAVELEKTGAKVDFHKDADLAFPAEFLGRLAGDPDLAAAFDGLTRGRQRAYSLYFSEPKQSATRAARVEKSVPRILEGKGLNDR